MRIQIVSQWYPPEPASNVRELATGLKELGHEVQVLTGFPNYPTGVVYEGYQLRPWKIELSDGIRVIRSILYPEHSRSAIRRVLNYLSFSIAASLVGALRVRKADCIFVYGTPYTAAVPAVVLGVLWRVPIVFNVQDLWPDTLAATGMMKRGPILRLVESGCRLVYRCSSLIQVISRGFEQALLNRGVPKEKVRMIPNWVDTDSVVPMTRDAFYRKELGLEGRCVIAFAGYIGLPQDLSTVVRAAAILAKTAPDVHFLIAGDGLCLPELKSEAQSLGLTNVTFLGRLPESQMSRLYSVADGLLVHLRDEPLFRITIPHKILSYLAGGKPVIAALAGDGAAVVTSAGAGLACSPGNPEALARTIAEFSTLSAEVRAKMGEAARAAAVSEFSQRDVIARISEMLEEAVRMRKAQA